MVDRLIKWLIFGIVLALVPLGIFWLINFILDNKMSYEETVAKGELFIIAAGLCGASLSELLIGSKFRVGGIRLGLGGISVVILLISGALYSVVSTPNILTQAPNQNAIMLTSSVLYVGALIINGFSICAGGISNANDI